MILNEENESILNKEEDSNMSDSFCDDYFRKKFF